MIRIVYYGGILHNNILKHLVVESHYNKIITNLNNWFFDYFYSNDIPVKKLPVLDDWSRSEENIKYWYIGFPSTEWHVWVQSEYIEF